MAKTKGDRGTHSGQHLPWWTWVLPFFLFHIGTRTSLLFCIAPGTSIWYLPIPIGIFLITLWGPRVLIGLYLNAVLCAGMWDLPRWYLWPFYAMPETLEVFLSWLLYVKYFRGSYWLANVKHTLLFVLFGILIPVSFGVAYLQGQFWFFGDNSGDQFLWLFYTQLVADGLGCLAVTVPLLVFLGPWLNTKGLVRSHDSTPQPTHPLFRLSFSLICELAAISSGIVLISLLLPLERFWFLFGFFGLWAALRYGVRAAVLANILVVVMTLILPAVAFGDLQINWGPNTQLVYFHMGLSILYLSTLITGRSISDVAIEMQNRQRTEDELRKTNVDLQKEITEREHSEKIRASLEHRLQQSEKMEAIGTLAGGIAHDFNNILSSVIGFTELTFIELPDDSVEKENLTMVLRAAERARQLVKQILTFSRREERERKPLDLAQVIHESLKFLDASIPKTIEIRRNIDQNTRSIFADTSQMHQVIMNLCTNAYQAMKEKGGILEINLSQVSVKHGQETSLPPVEPGEFALLEVSDTGCGMNQETMSRIFEPFYTTKSTGKGTGMGLAVVHGIVESHHGAISVESEEGKGTTFQVFLPIFGDLTEKIPDDLQKTFRGNEEHILFVDDEEGIAIFSQQMLQSLNYRVTIFTSPMEALEMFTRSPDQIDLVITDQTMPVLTGDQLAKKMLSIRENLPVIICTGYSDVLDEQKALKIGAKALLTKPVRSHSLAEAIHRALGE